MKLSDYLVSYLKKITDSVFLLSGGGIMHVVDSLRKSSLAVYCCHHEQAAATAAEGYARIKGSPGVVVVTSGPGGTNAITGVAGAWLDSIPMLVISGQVKTDNLLPRKNGKPLLRSLGFQELNIIDMVRPITKYAEMILNPEDIRFHLEKAIYLATNGRPGPVWLDIPLDIQTKEINTEKLHGFQTNGNKTGYKIPWKLITDKLTSARKPLLMAGNGIRLASGRESLLKVIDMFKINTVTPIFTASDLVESDNPYYLGRQGMWGNERANYAVDNCDVLLIIGERMQLTQTSYEYQDFARNAYIIMVDIDKNEINKKTLRVDLPVVCDARYFLEGLLKQKLLLPKWQVSKKEINLHDFSTGKKYVNPYLFFEELNKHLDGINIATADAMASLVTNQSARIKNNQRLLTNAGLGQMGSGLPLAIGACIASGKKTTVCMEGDGSLMLNLSQLQVVKHHRLPLKLFIFNNNGYLSIRNTHLAYFGKIFAADPSTGVSLPDYSKLIKAWGFPYEKISEEKDLVKIKKIMNHPGPVVVELMIDPEQPMLPKWTAGMLTDQNEKKDFNNRQ